MKWLALAAGLICFSALPAHAGWMIPGGEEAPRHAARSHGRHHLAQREYRHRETGFASAAGNRVRFAACARYGNLQCGCTASMIAFGRVLPGLPLVSEWLRFPRTSPHVGAAAIWPGRHVEIVEAANGDGTVDTKGSVGWRHVSAARLIFVEPRNYAVRQRNYRYARL